MITHCSASTDRGHLGLIVVGEGQPYRRGEIAKALDVPVITSIARDPTDGRSSLRRTSTPSAVRLLAADPQHSGCFLAIVEHAAAIG